ncbi:MAG: TolC family protein, partial [Methylococcaceae bacterium]|nr:TolC family protein [Methylococcaceae bacterium]
MSHWQAEPKTNFKTANHEELKTWWKSFGDARLDHLMNQALAGNLDVKIALARIDQARAERSGTRAELFPAVNVRTGAQRQENPMPGFAPGIKYNMFELG